MAVVISDFEVVVDPSPGERSPATPTAAVDAPMVVLTPQEIELLIERQAERAARLRAH